MKTGANIEKNLTEQEALIRLEAAANKLVKDARWHSYYNIKRTDGRINLLRKPLLELKLARLNRS